MRGIGDRNNNYKNNPRPSYQQKPSFQCYNQHPKISNNSNKSTLQVIIQHYFPCMAEKFSKDMQDMNEKMNQMAREMEQLKMDYLY